MEGLQTFVFFFFMLVLINRNFFSCSEISNSSVFKSLESLLFASDLNSSGSNVFIALTKALEILGYILMFKIHSFLKLCLLSFLKGVHEKFDKTFGS